MADIENEAIELSSGNESLRFNAGDTETRLRLLELTLADTVSLLCRVSTMLIELDRKVKRG